MITKLLKSGNQLIITSKPRLEIIEVLCKELRPFKSHFIFRFTIGANKNDILSFWEPNAPSYQEREEALKLAFDKKFKTSVSVEPMLDPDNIEELINDLLPCITDSIWLGKMTGTDELVNRLQREEVKQAIERIESGQTDEKLKAFYERHKENPKIKYKDSVKKIVGIERVTRP